MYKLYINMYSINFISLFKSNIIYVCGERSKTSNVFKNKKEEIHKSQKISPQHSFATSSPKLNLKSNTTKKKEEVKSKIKYNFKLQKKGRGGGLGTSFIDRTNNVNVNVKVKPMITFNKIH